MAGHSHWARIKRAKSVTDARRGRVWSRLSRGIIVAARQGGGDPDSNLALRYAIDAARDANMPKDTIERAIKKGTGEIGGAALEELVFEGYGPGGAAVLCRVLTDNRNRTAPEIKRIFEMHGGNVGSANCVAWMFTKRGVFVVAASQTDEDTLTGIALESGADDVQSLGDAFELTCDPTAFGAVRQALEAAGIKPESAEVSMVASSQVNLAGAEAERMLKLIEALEDHDDVQAVHSNFEVSEADMTRLSGG
ncbi:MAG: YebC/PmpR family DNA-binding transcriptional regulator [Planctomycetota bacterium]